MPPSTIPLQEVIEMAEAENALETVGVITQASEAATALAMLATGVVVLAGALVVVALAAGVIYLLTTDFRVPHEKFPPGGVEGLTDYELPPARPPHPISEPGVPETFEAPAANSEMAISEAPETAAPFGLPSPSKTPTESGLALASSSPTPGALGRGRHGPSGQARPGEVEVELSPNTPGRFQPLKQLLGRGGKWTDLSKADRSGLGRSFGSLLGQLAARM